MSKAIKTQEQQSKATPKEQAKTKGERGLQIIKHWMAERTFTEKLTAVLLWQLNNKESCFEGPDRKLPNELFLDWEEEIIQASENPAKMMADHDGFGDETRAEIIAVTMKCATWIPMSV
jgi:hypothetical protein